MDEFIFSIEEIDYITKISNQGKDDDIKAKIENSNAYNNENFHEAITGLVETDLMIHNLDNFLIDYKEEVNSPNKRWLKQMNRFNNILEKKKNWIDQMAKEINLKKEIETASCTGKPSINKNSRKLVLLARSTIGRSDKDSSNSSLISLNLDLQSKEKRSFKSNGSRNLSSPRNFKPKCLDNPQMKKFIHQNSIPEKVGWTLFNKTKKNQLKREAWLKSEREKLEEKELMNVTFIPQINKSYTPNKKAKDSFEKSYSPLSGVKERFYGNHNEILNFQKENKVEAKLKFIELMEIPKEKTKRTSSVYIPTLLNSISL